MVLSWSDRKKKKNIGWIELYTKTKHQHFLYVFIYTQDEGEKKHGEKRSKRRRCHEQRETFDGRKTL